MKAITSQWRFRMFYPGQVALFFLFLNAIGCGGQSPPALTQRQLIEKYPYGAPIDWEHNPPVDTSYDFKSLETQSPAVMAALRRWETAASAKRQPDWFHQPWYRDPKSAQAIITWWSSMAEHVGPEGRLERGGVGYPTPSHHIRISYHPGYEKPPGEFASLGAERQPLEGWGGSLSAVVREGGLEAVNLGFHPRGALIEEVPNSLCAFPVGHWDYKATFQDVHYELEVNVGDVERGRAGTGLVILPQGGLTRWSSSAESFREAMIEPLLELEEAIRSQVMSDAAVKRVYTVKVHGGEHGGDPPWYESIPSDRSLSPTEKQAVLDDGLKKVIREREVFEKHYRAMHAVLLEVFPLDQIDEPPAR